MAPAEPERPAVGPGFADLGNAYQAAAMEIEKLPDPASAFAHATELRNRLDRLVGEAAGLRARMAVRIWEAEELSLAALANRIGVSKGRAQQFIQTAKAADAVKEAEKER